MCFPNGLGELVVNAFGLAPDGNNCAPSDSNSEVKRGCQGSGVLDLGIVGALGRLGASVAAKPTGETANAQ